MQMSVGLLVRQSVRLSPFVFFPAYQANAAWTSGGLIYLMMLINC